MHNYRIPTILRLNFFHFKFSEVRVLLAFDGM
jgi:hypothetical protein